MKKYTSDFTFKAEDDWGDFYKGNYRKPWFNKLGYSCKNYKDNNGNWFFMEEHRAKWIYFNGDIPEGYEIDHIIPIKNGGTNKLSNLRLVTKKENSNNEQTRKNRSETYMVKWKDEEYRKKMLTIRNTPEWKEKLRKANVGKKGIVKEEQCKHVYQYESDEIVNVFYSLHDASNKTGFNRERIKYHCKDGKEYKGYKWSFVPL